MNELILDSGLNARATGRDLRRQSRRHLKCLVLRSLLSIACLLPTQLTWATSQPTTDVESVLAQTGEFLRSNCALAATRTNAGSPLAPDSFMSSWQAVGSRASWPTSSAWGLEFRKTLCPHFALSLAYLNDGHFPGHHRDGVSAEAWVPFTIAHQVTLSFGAGPFYYFDTENAANASGYADVHGWAWLFSADLRVPLWLGHPYHPGWFTDIRFDWSAPAKDIETHSIAWTIGYQMYSDFSLPQQTQDTVEGFAPDEVVTYAGKTVVNSFHSQHSLAEAIEYRRALGSPFFRGSVAFVNEGDAQLIRRRGVIYELWLEPSFWNGNASIGVGWGGYTAIDKYRRSPGRHVSYVVSVTLSARPFTLIPCLTNSPVAERTDFRVTWHRIITDYNRDTDILLFGLGYRF